MISTNYNVMFPERISGSSFAGTKPVILPEERGVDDGVSLGTRPSFGDGTADLQKLRNNHQDVKVTSKTPGLLERFNLSSIKRIGVMVCLGATLFSSVAGAFPTVAGAEMPGREPVKVEQVVQKEESRAPVYQTASGEYIVNAAQFERAPGNTPVQETRQEVRQEKQTEAQIIQEARSHGVSEKVIREVCKEKGADSLDTVMDKTVEVYNTMSPVQRDTLYNTMNGVTKKAFISINNKDAFVKGKVAGVNVFGEAVKLVDKKMNEGIVTLNEANYLKECVRYASTLSSAEREVMVNVFSSVYNHGPQVQQLARGG